MTTIQPVTPYDDERSWQAAHERSGYLRAVEDYAPLLAAAEAVRYWAEDDHDCGICASGRPDGRGGIDHETDCPIRLLRSALAAVKGGQG